MELLTWWISMEYALRLRTTRSGRLNIVLLLDKSLSFNPSSVAHTTCGGWMNQQFLIEYKKVSPRNVFRVLPLKSWLVFGFYESGNVLCWLVVLSHLGEVAKPSKQLFVTQNVEWNRLMYIDNGKPFGACSTGRTCIPE